MDLIRYRGSRKGMSGSRLLCATDAHSTLQLQRRLGEPGGLVMRNDACMKVDKFAAVELGAAGTLSVLLKSDAIGRAKSMSTVGL